MESEKAGERAFRAGDLRHLAADQGDQNPQGPGGFGPEHFPDDLPGFAVLAAAPNVLALPVADYFMNIWLQNFAYRIGLSIRTFLLFGLAAFGIALFTVSYQSIKAATANPVDPQRYE